MEAEDIRALRKRLKISMKGLADHLGVEVSVVSAWESGTLYATKKHVDMMAGLAAHPPEAPKKKDLFEGFLSDPRLLTALRKLMAHDDLQKEFLALAEKFEDPAE